MAKVREIRASLETDENQKVAADFAILTVILGKDYNTALMDAIKNYNKKFGKPLKRGTWLSQTDLIARLKTDFDITTNSQTLMNYRKEGRLNKAFCSDGQKKVFYLLEEVKKVLTAARPRQQPEKQSAV